MAKNSKFIDNNSLHFSCEPCDGEYLDTRVEFNGNYLCTITFSDIENFTNGFSSWLSKYRI